jgi:rare lipoprotein A
MKKALFFSAGLHFALLVVFLISGCGMTSSRKQRGMASWYGPGFYGNQTANQEAFDPSRLTAAHRKLPFGTYVRVTRLDKDKSVVVRINDRGPFIRGRIIDLSETAAREIDMLEDGVAPVIVEVIHCPLRDDRRLR